MILFTMPVIKTVIKEFGHLHIIEKMAMFGIMDPGNTEVKLEHGIDIIGKIFKDQCTVTRYNGSPPAKPEVPKGVNRSKRLASLR